MKRIVTSLSIVLLFGLTAFQCNRELDCCVMPPCSEKATLTGTWRLTALRNVVTGELENDPDPNGKGVVFTFTDDEKEGGLEGHTFVNTVFGGYTLGPECSIELKSFGGSKVGEPAWSGKAWLAAAKGNYQIQSDKMILTFQNAKESLIFKKLK